MFDKIRNRFVSNKNADNSTSVEQQQEYDPLKKPLVRLNVLSMVFSVVVLIIIGKKNWR